MGYTVRTITSGSWRQSSSLSKRSLSVLMATWLCQHVVFSKSESVDEISERSVVNASVYGTFCPVSL